MIPSHAPQAIGPDRVNELISFRVAEQEFCVDIMSVREIRGWTPATPLPHAPPYVMGVVNLRGAVLPVIDVAARLGMAVAEPTSRHVVIVVWIRGKLVGLLVDAVCDVLSTSEETMQPAPDVGGAAINAFVSALVTADDRMLGLIALESLLPAGEAEAA
jgi:purine-binding chemotaxis protein CheW